MTGYVKDWLTKKISRHLMKAKRGKGFGWQRWSTKELYEEYKKIDSDFKAATRKVVPRPIGE